MPFETPLTPQAEKKVAPDHLKRGLMEAGEATFYDGRSVSREKESKSSLRENVVDSQEIIGIFFPKGAPDMENLNRRAALESMVSESQVSWDELAAIKNLKSHSSEVEKITEEYLSAWRSTSSDAAKRSRMATEAFVTFVRSNLH